MESEQQQAAQEARAEGQRSVDEDADKILRRMSEYLGGLPAFGVTVDHATEVVLESGEKLQLLATSNVKVQRPNKLRSDRYGQIVDVRFQYDGETLTVYGARSNSYAQMKAPATLDETIDFARARLDVEAPGSDLLYSEPYGILLEDVVSGMRVGTATIDGVPCEHLAFRGNQVDWQVWIQHEPTPLPLRFVITTKDVKGNPEFTVSLHDWDTSPAFRADVFKFEPPAGAKQVALAPTERRIDILSAIGE